MEFRLRKWKIEDIMDVAYYANNEKIACNLRDVFPHPYTVSDAEKYVSSCVSNDETRQVCRAIVVNDRVVGSIGIFFGSDVYSKSGEVGYWLAEDFWNKGIMSQAIIRICSDVFQRYDIIRIYAEPFAYNIGSRRALEKAGFDFEGIMRNGVFKNGMVFDYCMYSLLKDDELKII